MTHAKTGVHNIHMERLKSSGRPTSADGPMGEGWIVQKQVRVRGKDGKLTEQTQFTATWATLVTDAKTGKRNRSRRGNNWVIGRTDTLKPKRGQTALEAAKEKWEEVRFEVMNGRPSEHTLRSFLDTVFTPWRRTHWHTPDMEGYFTYVMSLLKQDRPLAEVTDRELQEQLNTMVVNGLSEALVKKVVMYAKLVFRYAMEQGAITRDPARYIHVPPGAKKKSTSALSAPALQKLLANIPQRPTAWRDTLMVKLLWCSAVRKQELFGMRVSDVQSSSVKIERQWRPRERAARAPKLSSGRVAQIPSELASEILEYIERNRLSPEAWLWQSTGGREGREPQPINASNWLRDVLRPAAKAAGIARINYQMIRRSFASEAHDAGVPDAAIAAQMGHKDSTVTRQAYTKVIEGAQAEAAKIVAARGLTQTPTLVQN